jgi:hypothetical protein
MTFSANGVLMSESENKPQGVPLKSRLAVTPTRPQDVFGVLPHSGEPKTLDEMDAGVLAEARRRHARD